MRGIVLLLAFVQARNHGPGQQCHSLMQTQYKFEKSQEHTALIQTASSVARDTEHVGPTQIPCVIHQTWKTHELDSSLGMWFNTWAHPGSRKTCDVFGTLVQASSPDRPQRKL